MTTYRRIIRRRVEAALQLRVAPSPQASAVEPTMDALDELKAVPVSLDGAPSEHK